MIAPRTSFRGHDFRVVSCIKKMSKNLQITAKKVYKGQLNNFKISKLNKFKQNDQIFSFVKEVQTNSLHLLDINHGYF